MRRVRVRLRARREEYDIRIGRGTLALLGEVARSALGPQARRAFLVSNPTVFDLYGRPAAESLRAAGFKADLLLIGDGERHKSLATLQRALAAFHDAGLERGDAVVALGGGVVGDLAGFAAAIYLRGVAFLQVPTTLLAQVDASVGGKVAVNTAAGKNLVGAFHHPRAVLVDTATLQTLPRRELTAGWCESVKQGAAGDRALFDQTCAFLRSGADTRSEKLAQLIAAQVAFKARVVAGDEREDISRTDGLSRRILNFGHTTAHALEAVTRYWRFRHGEAVGHGMLVAGEISKRLGLLDASELELLRNAVRLCGRLPPAGDLDESEIIGRLSHDKKVVGGRVKWVLLERLGRARVVDGGEVTHGVLRASLRAGLRGSFSEQRVRVKQ